MTNIKVGQKLFLVGVQRYSKREPGEATVDSVGRKYFTVAELRRTKFYIDSLEEVTDEYSPAYKLYLSRSEWEEKQTKAALWRQVSEICRAYQLPDISIQDLEQILKLLNRSQQSNDDGANPAD